MVGSLRPDVFFKGADNLQLVLISAEMKASHC